MRNQIVKASKAFAKGAFGVGLMHAQTATSLKADVTPEYLCSDDLSGGTAVLSKANPVRRFCKFLKIFGHAKRKTTDAIDQENAGIDNKSAATTDTEDEYDDDGEPTDDEHDRRNFKAIRAITRNTLQKFVLDILCTEEEVLSRTCRVQTRKEGSFHHVVFLHTGPGDHTDEDYVLKIPAHGTPASWEEGDAFMLRNEAHLLQHIRHHTQCPVPEVVAFDETLENPIGVPYILMKELPGLSAYDMWQEGGAHLNADDPSPELQQKRVTFLESLANAMARLQKLDFKMIGTPIFNCPDDDQAAGFGPVWRWHFPDVRT